ncbi:MAG: adenine-specific DNA-methyltransferase [Anaerophaga sp.]|nr:adenine-specific DNA-methyltransferase [Anaerophaga sp.]
MAANRIQLQNTLHKPYDRVLFSREVLSPVFGSGFNLSSSLIPAPVPPNKSESAAIDKVSIYANITLDDSTEITCYEVLLQPQVRIEQSKVAIQQYVRKLLTAGQAALINFVPGRNFSPSGEMSAGQRGVWRLTLVAKDSVLTDKGVKEKTTNAKRYTFLLGPSETCKTAAERFEKLSTEKEINFQSLINAFSVEKLSKAFFDEYTLHYQNFCDYLQESNYRKSVFNISFPADATKQEKDKACKPIRDFVKKLLGRIVFLYFVQKKGWLGASDTNYTDGMPDFIKQLFHKSGGNDTFYSNWLSVLFFDTLNKERPTDDFKMPDGKTVKVPFLNGGLFDKDEFDKHLLTFRANLFHNPDFEDTILTGKSNGNARGFLDFLDAFNFTVYEDSPDDHTIAVDPEMLGHIFENLLEDNKDKGAFYTPKEIVHYMCQESLIEYLATGLQNNYTVYRQIGDNQIELFGNETRKGQLKLIEELGEKGLDRDEVAYMVKQKDISNLKSKQLHSIDNLLDKVKICDPAIGSGAFPMGLLQEIFSIKELIAYETGKDWNPAETKLNIIQNSIYGVDIEKGAVDIARLRFWLSLVVDEEKPKPLPNLDYKIVVGDSLISKFDGEIVEIDWERKQSVGKADEYVKNVQRLLKEVAEKQKQYFNPNNKNKKELKIEIRNLKIELLINQLSFNKELYINKTVQKGGFMPTAADIKHNTKRQLQIAGFDKLISKLKNLLQHPDEPFNHFDWKLDFPEVLNPYLVNGNGGFDIVIGNPPYVDSETMVNNDPKYREYIKKKFNSAKGNWDLFVVFIDHSLNILVNKGQIAFIIPNKLLSANYTSSLRERIIQLEINEIRDYSRLNIFKEANVYPITITINNRNTKKEFVRMTVMDDPERVGYSNPIPKNIFYKDIYWDKFFFNREILKIVLEIFKYPPLKDNYSNATGSATVNEAYLLKEVIIDQENNGETKKLINTGTIDKWRSLWGLKDTQYIKDKYIFPRIKNKDLKSINPNRLIQANSSKIIIAGMSSSIEAFLDLDGEYLAGKSTSIIIDKKENLKYLICILNSRLISFFINIYYHSLKMSGGYLNISPDIINNLPVAKEEHSKSILSLPDYIIFLSKRSEVSEMDKLILTYFEQISDGIVYELYFPELLKKHNREIIQHLGELPEFTEGMNDEQKMNICKKVFDRLNDKEHPVRINLEKMKEEIPEIRIIEGLEK